MTTQTTITAVLNSPPPGRPEIAWLDEITPWHTTPSGNQERSLVGTTGPVCLEVDDTSRAHGVERRLSLSIVVPDFKLQSVIDVGDLCELAQAVGASVGDFLRPLRDLPSKRSHFDLGIDEARALHAGLGEALAAVDSLLWGEPVHA
ncbi:MAG: hypothetical protein LBS56_10310 [Propionibacteriaceae bacterium]|jgi:hypothetical protein|nr:hypothetical protein [Propionibacteriaceae bacterium]